jgi:outer membrane biosynthesis protein TonB
MDTLFLGMLLASVLFHFSLATFIALSPAPPEDDINLDQLPDRFAKMLIPPKPPEQHKEEAKAEAPKEKPVAKKEKPAEADPSERKAAIQKKVASKGLLKVLGSMGASGGALDDVLGASTGAADIANAIQGAAGVSVADAASVGGPRGGASGKQAGIGDLGTSGGGKVNLGKGDAKVSGRVQEAAPDVDSADVDRQGLARYVKMRLKAIQGCYERELKRNPSLRGKVLVRFSITPAGRAGSISIEENSLNESVASCIKAVIHGWVFPFKPQDEVPVAYPFVFSPAS